MKESRQQRAKVASVPKVVCTEGSSDLESFPVKEVSEKSTMCKDSAGRSVGFTSSTGESEADIWARLEQQEAEDEANGITECGDNRYVC